MADIKAEIVEHIATIGVKSSWPIELNRVSWNGAAPKLDLRAWSEDHEKMSKGITLNDEEAKALHEALERII